MEYIGSQTNKSAPSEGQGALLLSLLQLTSQKGSF